MVYIDPDSLGYLPYVRSWIDASVEANLFTEEYAPFVYELFEMAAAGLKHVNAKCSVGIRQVRK